MQTINATTTFDLSPLSQDEQIALHRERWIMQLESDLRWILFSGGDPNDAYRITRALINLSR